jgi:hypothetical protein
MPFRASYSRHVEFSTSVATKNVATVRVGSPGPFRTSFRDPSYVYMECFAFVWTTSFAKLSTRLPLPNNPCLVCQHYAPRYRKHLHITQNRDSFSALWPCACNLLIKATLTVSPTYFCSPKFSRHRKYRHQDSNPVQFRFVTCAPVISSPK